LRNADILSHDHLKEALARARGRSTGVLDRSGEIHSPVRLAINAAKGTATRNFYVKGTEGSDLICELKRLGVFVSEAVSTYRTHADWNLRVADATPDPKDADVLRKRARHVLDLADWMNDQENALNNGQTHDSSGR
jgi:hypothetical protein